MMSFKSSFKVYIHSYLYIQRERDTHTHATLWYSTTLSYYESTIYTNVTNVQHWTYAPLLTLSIADTYMAWQVIQFEKSDDIQSIHSQRGCKRRCANLWGFIALHHRSGDIPAGFGMVNGEAGKFQLIKISRMPCLPCSNLGPDRIQDWCNMTGGCALKRQDGTASCSNLRARSGALLETSTSYKVQSLWLSSLV